MTSAYFLDDKRFLGEVAIAADPHLRDAFFAATKRAQEIARLRRFKNPLFVSELAKIDTPP